MSGMKADVFGKEVQLAGLRFGGFRFQYDEENDEGDDADTLVMLWYRKTAAGWHAVPEVSSEVYTALDGHDRGQLELGSSGTYRELRRAVEARCLGRGDY